MGEKENDRASESTIALVLAIISIGAWIIPVIGIPVSATGIVLAGRTMKYTKSGVALGICILALFASCVNSAIGVMQASQSSSSDSSYYQ